MPHLRPLRRADREPLRELLQATGAFHEEELAVALELIDLGLQPGGGGYRFLVAEEQAADQAGAVLGYACWGETPMARGVFDLYWIAVDPRSQQHGVGRRLLAAAEADVRASGGRMLLIETGGKPSYAPQRAFYLACGYTEIARVPDFYRPGDDKLIYCRRFER